jgi:hypothetical protein
MDKKYHPVPEILECTPTSQIKKIALYGTPKSRREISPSNVTIKSIYATLINKHYAPWFISGSYALTRFFRQAGFDLPIQGQIDVFIPIAVQRDMEDEVKEFEKVVKGYISEMKPGECVDFRRNFDQKKISEKENLPDKIIIEGKEDEPNLDHLPRYNSIINKSIIAIKKYRILIDPETRGNEEDLVGAITDIQFIGLRTPNGTREEGVSKLINSGNEVAFWLEAKEDIEHEDFPVPYWRNFERFAVSYDTVSNLFDSNMAIERVRKTRNVGENEFRLRKFNKVTMNL